MNFFLFINFYLSKMATPIPTSQLQVPADGHEADRPEPQLSLEVRYRIHDVEKLKRKYAKVQERLRKDPRQTVQL